MRGFAISDRKSRTDVFSQLMKVTCLENVFFEKFDNFLNRSKNFAGCSTCLETQSTSRSSIEARTDCDS